MDHVKSNFMYFDFFLAFLTCCCIALFCVFSLSVRKPSIPVNVLRMFNQSLLATHTGIVVWWTTTLKYQSVSVEEDLFFSMLSRACFASLSIRWWDIWDSRCRVLSFYHTKRIFDVLLGSFKLGVSLSAQQALYWVGTLCILFAPNWGNTFVASDY